MKSGIHPDYTDVTVTCSCGNQFTTRSTSKSSAYHADVCSACHPFYTGKQKILDIGGRVDKFNKKFGTRTRPGASAPEATVAAEAGAADATAPSS